LPVGASEACRLPLPACFLMPDAPDLNLLPPPGDELRSESNLPISDTAAREICRISDGEHFLLPAATAASAASPRWLPTASAAQGRQQRPQVLCSITRQRGTPPTCEK
jgi:hypothetical protein